MTARLKTAGLLLLSLTALVNAQTSPSNPAPSPNPNQDQFREAAQQFQAKHYDIALIDFKKLIALDPTNNVYKKFASEAALNSGDPAFVIETLLPVEVATPDDWQARTLLARAYAQTAAEPDHKKKRDEEVAAIIRLHDADPNSQLGKLRDFLLETVHQGDKTIQFFPALTPWGPYKINLIARTFDASGQPGLRLTLESNDLEQPAFAKQHPAEAAAGQRAYSLDGYAPDQKNAQGQTVQTHYTFAFFTGKPTYDDLRDKVLAATSGTLKPMSSRVGPVN